MFLLSMLVVKKFLSNAILMQDFSQSSCKSWCFAYGNVTFCYYSSTRAQRGNTDRRFKKREYWTEKTIFFLIPFDMSHSHLNHTVITWDRNHFSVSFGQEEQIPLGMWTMFSDRLEKWWTSPSQWVMPLPQPKEQQVALFHWVWNIFELLYLTITVKKKKNKHLSVARKDI